MWKKKREGIFPKRLAPVLGEILSFSFSRMREKEKKREQ